MRGVSRFLRELPRTGRFRCACRQPQRPATHRGRRTTRASTTRSCLRPAIGDGKPLSAEASLDELPLAGQVSSDSANRGEHHETGFA